MDTEIIHHVPGLYTLTRHSFPFEVNFLVDMNNEQINEFKNICKHICYYKVELCNDESSFQNNNLSFCDDIFNLRDAMFVFKYERLVRHESNIPPVVFDNCKICDSTIIELGRFSYDINTNSIVPNLNCYPVEIIYGKFIYRHVKYTNIESLINGIKLRSSFKDKELIYKDSFCYGRIIEFKLCTYDISTNINIGGSSYQYIKAEFYYDDKSFDNILKYIANEDRCLDNIFIYTEHNESILKGYFDKGNCFIVIENKYKINIKDDKRHDLLQKYVNGEDISTLPGMQLIGNNKSAAKKSN